MTNAYLEVISLIERLHRHFLEVVKLELEGLRQCQEDGRKRISPAGALAARPPFDPRSFDRKRDDAARPGERHASAPSRYAVASHDPYGRSSCRWRDTAPARAVLDPGQRPGATAAIRRLIFLVTARSRAAKLRARR